MYVSKQKKSHGTAKQPPPLCWLSAAGLLHILPRIDRILCVQTVHMAWKNFLVTDKLAHLKIIFICIQDKAKNQTDLQCAYIESEISMSLLGLKMLTPLEQPCLFKTALRG